jgi:DnaA family protein
MKKQQQMVFDLCLKDEDSFENFYEASNQELVSHLKRLNNAPLDRFLYLWGPIGSGRTHLLSACCQRFQASDFRVAYLPLADFAALDPHILDNLESYSLLCIDDINLIVQQQAWEEAVFHCYNKLSSSNTILMVTANLPPQSINFILPDLKSRLSSCMIFQVHALTDEQKLIALKCRAQNRGLVLSESVVQFLLNHYRRSTSDLFSFLERLDHAALEKRQKITIPLVKKII